MWDYLIEVHVDQWLEHRREHLVQFVAEALEAWLDYPPRIGEFCGLSVGPVHRFSYSKDGQRDTKCSKDNVSILGTSVRELHVSLRHLPFNPLGPTF